MTDGIRDQVSEDLVPGWLQRSAAFGWRILVTLALGLVVIAIALQLSTVTASILVGLIITTIFAPFVQQLRARGWNRTKAAGVVSLIALAAVVVVLVLLAGAFAPYLAAVLSAMKAGAESISTWLADLGAPPPVAAVIGHIMDGIEGFLASAISGMVGPIASFVTSLILGGFLTFFLLQDGDRAWGWLIAPIQGWRADAISASGGVALERVGGYLRGTTILAAVDAMSDLAFLAILGVPLAGPLAVFVFAAGFVPYLGRVSAAAVLVLVTWGSLGPTSAALLMVLIIVVNVLVGRYLAPVIRSRSLGVHPALILISLPIGAALFGLIGVFAALPLLAFVMAVAPTIIYALEIDPNRAGDGSGLVPIWLDRLGQWSWRALVVVAVLAVIVAALISAPGAVLPVVLAVVLAATLDPAAARLQSRGLSRGLAAVAATAGTMIVIVAFVVLALVMLAGPLEEMVATATAGASRSPVGSEPLVDFVRALSSGFLGQVARLFAGIGLFLVGLFLATLLTVYFLRDGRSMWGWFLGRLSEPRRALLGPIGPKSAGVLGGYMIGTAIVSAFGAATTAILMIILGLPLALPIAVLAFFLGFIPYIGGFIATGLAFLVTVAAGSTTDVVIMAIFTIVFNIAQGNFVGPLVYGKAVSLHPAVVLLAIPAGNEIAGIVGMFLVVPFLGVVALSWRTLLRVVDADASDATGGSEPPGSPDPVPGGPARPGPAPGGTLSPEQAPG